MKIFAKPGKGDKIHILIDGEYRFTVDSDFWYSCPYRTVKEINDGGEDEFLELIGTRHAFLSGLRILSYGDHPKKETVQRLCQKGNKREYAEKAAELLEYYGYINDSRFAENFAFRLINDKGMSLRGIRYELKRRGVSDEITAQVLSEIDFDSQSEIIYSLVEKKYFKYLNDEKGRRKVFNALVRLGYSYSDIKSVLNKFETDTEIEDFYE
ncbi:MAG: RecX family transcriptional regulator [Clostridiales bacterium]|nr:RecX family transcriptional regulator [Clostridiales bacterium]